MADFLTLHKFPEGSANLDYFVFEKLTDGSAVWRGCVLGMESVELKLQKLARESNNKFFALNLRRGPIPAIYPSLESGEFRCQ
jgi:hypothetical protein